MARSRLRVYVTAFLVGMLSVAGVATAQWLANGTGEGYAKATQAQELDTLETSSYLLGDLYPGGTGDLTLEIANPNPYPVTVMEVNGAGAITSDTEGCTEATHAVTYTSQTGLSLAVPAGGSAMHVLQDSVTMGPTSADACQGATFTIPISLVGRSGDGSTVGLIAYGTDVGECQVGYKDSEGNVVIPAVEPTDETVNGLDDDCNGVVDDTATDPALCDDGNDATIDTNVDGACFYELAADAEYYYVDGDADTFGAGDPVAAFELADGYSTNADDCDDTDASIHPGAVETLDGVDQDCDGTVDDGV